MHFGGIRKLKQKNKKALKSSWLRFKPYNDGKATRLDESKIKVMMGLIR